MAPFDAQGVEEYSAEHAAGHIVMGPLYLNGSSWQVFCLEPEALVQYNMAMPGPDDRFDREMLWRAMPILKYLPDEPECRNILDRWRTELRYICTADQPRAFAAMACLRGLVDEGICADQLFEPVTVIVESCDTAEKQRRLRDLCYALWYMGMYQRRWAGPGTAYPILEDDTHVQVTEAAVSDELLGEVDPETGAALDEISTFHDGAVGLLGNCVRMHARRALDLMEDATWLGDPVAQRVLQGVRPASLHVRALVPRHTLPSRLVHSLLPADRSTLRSLIQRCVDGSECIRMSSARLCLSAVMLWFATGRPTPAGAPWRQQTAGQGDPILQLHRLANII